VAHPMPWRPADLKVVGISELLVSTDDRDVLVTYSLGSCVALSLHDPVAGVGGLIHCKLPVSKLDPQEARMRPCNYVDTGLPELLRAVFNRGATRKNLVAKVVGAARKVDHESLFQTGRRNYAVVRKVLWKNSILIDSEDVGGTHTRSVFLEMATGKTFVRSQGRMIEL
jgi:chemotaxis protein CheD